MDGRLWSKIINYSLLSKPIIINLLNMSSTDAETYTSCRKLCNNCTCKTNKYIYKFVKLDYTADWLKKIGILNYLGHPHVQKLSRVHFTKDNYIYYSTPYFAPVNIEHPMDAANLRFVDDNFIQKFIHDIVSAMAYLHQRNIIHGNISLSNTGRIEKSNGDYKLILTNFVDAKKIIPKQPILSSKYFYTCDYTLSQSQYNNRQLPPELTKVHTEHTTTGSVKQDVWSFGCILLYLFCKKQLIEIIEEYSIKNNLCHTYMDVVTNDTLLSTIITDAINVAINTKVVPQIMYKDPDILPLYRLAIILSLKININDRITSKGLARLFDIDSKLIYWDEWNTYIKKQTDILNVLQQCYVTRFIKEDFITIITNLRKFKLEHVISKNKLCNGDIIEEHIDMLWDTFDITPEIRYLYNSVIILFVNLAHRINYISPNNIWLLIMGCKFIVINIHVKLTDVQQFIKDNQESFTEIEFKSTVTSVLKSTKFNFISDIRW